MAYDRELADRIRERVAGVDGISEKAMFGGLAFLHRGHMAVAASGQGGLMVRVDPAEQAALLADPHAAPFEMRGREMAGWLRVAVEGLDDAALTTWVERGLAYTGTLPPK